MTVVQSNPWKAGDTSYKIKPTPYLMHASHSVAGQFGTSNRLFASIPIIWITFILPNKSFSPLTLLVLLILSSYLKLEKYWAFPLIWFTQHNLLCLRMKALNCIPCSLGFPCLQPTRLSIPFILSMPAFSCILPFSPSPFSMELASIYTYLPFSFPEYSGCYGSVCRGGHSLIIGVPQYSRGIPSNTLMDA